MDTPYHFHWGKNEDEGERRVYYLRYLRKDTDGLFIWRCPVCMREEKTEVPPPKPEPEPSILGTLLGLALYVAFYPTDKK